VFLGDGSERRAVADTGVGEDDVDPGETFRRIVQAVEIGTHRDVTRHGMCVRTELRDCGIEFGAAPAGDDDGGALVDEALCRRQPDTAAAPGDDRRLSVCRPITRSRAPRQGRRRARGPSCQD
jgi:hypothetical protein